MKKDKDTKGMDKYREKCARLMDKILKHYDNNGFLTKPKNWIKGTKMSFIGLKSRKERAAVILYMNKNSDSPLSLQ